MRAGQHLEVGVLVALCGLVLAGGPVATAAAGDGIAEFQFENRVVEAEPGETVTLSLIIDSDGGYKDGIGALGATVAVDPSIATITDVEHGPWLEDGSNVSIDRNATVSDGRATVRHERLGGPDDDGITGRDRFVSVTIRIAEDAPAADVEIGIVEADAELTRGFGLRTIQHTSTIAVDGGGETVAPDAGAGGDARDGGDGLDVTTAEDVGRERTNESTVSGDDSDSGDDSSTDGEGGSDAEPSNEIPGFTVTAGMIVLLISIAVLSVRYRVRGPD